ncbi:uncharacterized protein MONBRDRAFT_13001 [Monosiga brevicollis MX1]|uniref:Cytosol aminopeptidase domain-containing protein n=1 Tax=Monosiga brevicollis TaxID=81824 RepID=A9VE03_MONBE|nr:uncharacterized protein MONBRDRAFT_13001 [Monosiga brevicollis MX1]EDQ84221.1 predicted protein [Monosiga brevicollis MX1]|eukprot:XP_001750945.1 hypothetical protein [Monosiga brevicollis MX1]
MPATIVVAAQPDTTAQRTVYVGFRSAIEEALPVLEAENADLLVAVCRGASVSGQRGGKAHATVAHAGADVRLIDLVFIPEESTRYNCKYRPDAVSRLISDVDSGARTSVVVVLPSIEDEVESRGAVVALTAAVARTCQIYTRKKNASETSSSTHVTISFHLGQSFFTNETVLQHATILAEHVRQCARLVDMPCNELPVSELAAHARAVADTLPGVVVEEVIGEDLQAQGFGGIYGVGKAAEDGPRLVVLKHEPAGATRAVAMAGKGIVYDTGGLSIKGKTFMPGMKRDMGGAAGVLHAFATLVKTGFSQNLYCLLACAENAVGPRATRPDDIHVMYSGKTVEINNTDAEGRLVLADAVSYAAQTFKPELLLNMCTLTGAQGIATGQLHAGIVCSSEDVEQDAVRAGRRSGDLTHPLMWCPELFSNEFASSVADMKNSVRNRSNAQVSCAAQFIGNHLPDGFVDQHAWLHIDMAAPAFEGERGTGYGVALLYDLLHSRFGTPL